MEGSMIAYLAAAAVVYFTLGLLRRSRKNNLPPSPFALPIVGHLYLLFDPAPKKTLIRFANKYGHVILLRISGRNVLTVTSPAAAEECLTKNDLVFSNRIEKKYLSYDNTTLEHSPYGPYWRSLRRFSNAEFFSARQTARLVAMREGEVKASVRELLAPFTTAADSSYRMINVRNTLKELVANSVTQPIVGKRYFGKEKQISEEDSKHFRELWDEGTRLALVDSIEDYLPVLQRIGINQHNKRYQKVDEDLDKALQAVVDERRSDRSTSRHDEDKNALLDVMLTLQEQDPENYTDIYIKGVILLFVFGASESAGTTVEWSLALLLNHPEVLKQVREEIDTHVGHDRLVTDADLTNLQLLYRVLKETMRIYPFAPFLTLHESTADCNVGGYDIPGGTILMVNTYAIHRDPDLWEDPMSFKPDRFKEVEGADGKQSLTERGKGFKFFPFGAGRRMCPAELLSYRMMALALGTLIQCFDFKRIREEAVDMTEADGLTLLRLATPLEAKYKPRPAMISTLSKV